MKYMETINEMQAVMTKLRREIQRGEASKPELKSSEGWAEIYKNKFKVLDPDGWDRSNFSKSWAEPITEEEFNFRVSKSTCEGFSPTPDPLHVRVAKALGKDVAYSQKEPTQGWYIKSGKPTSCSLADLGYIEYILDYPNDLVAAMDSGLKYMEIVNRNRPVSTLEFRMQIDFYGDLSGTVRIIQPDSLSPDTKNRYELVVHFGKHGQECCEANGMLWAETKTEAICEAIVAHSEAK